MEDLRITEPSSCTEPALGPLRVQDQSSGVWSPEMSPLRLPSPSFSISSPIPGAGGASWAQSQRVLCGCSQQLHSLLLLTCLQRSQVSSSLSAQIPGGNVLSHHQAANSSCVGKMSFQQVPATGEPCPGVSAPALQPSAHRAPEAAEDLGAAHGPGAITGSTEHECIHCQYRAH